jgi:hypothetical protein
LPYHCNSVWLALPPARWGQFSSALSPMKLSDPPCPCFGRLACHPTPTFRLCAFPHLCLLIVQFLWKVGLSLHPALHLCSLSHLCSLIVCLLAPTPFSKAGSAFHTHTPLSVVDYNSLFMLFSFVGWWFNLPRGCAGLCSWGLGRGVACGACCSPVESADLHRQL